MPDGGLSCQPALACVPDLYWAGAAVVWLAMFGVWLARSFRSWTQDYCSGELSLDVEDVLISGLAVITMMGVFGVVALFLWWLVVIVVAIGLVVHGAIRALAGERI